MKTFKQMSQESNRDLAINVQKVIHTDTGGQGHHLTLSRKIRSAETAEEGSEILVAFEESRMEGIRGGTWPRLEILKSR